MSKRLIVAIDGPAGSGKSTSAKLVAQRLGYLYIDTGAMYRAITYWAMKTDIINDEEAVVKLARNAEIDLKFIDGSTHVSINGTDVSEEIRTREVNKLVSGISKIVDVRKALVKKQRHLSEKNIGVVMEGRDIGTVVFPHADVKVFLTATITQRAKRRRKEYEEKGTTVSLDEIKNNLLQRDKVDSTREVSPLTKAPDAIEVDTSKVSIDEQVHIILNHVREVANKKGIEVPL